MAWEGQFLEETSMPSFRTQISKRRQIFLLLASQVERQLRDAYDRRFQEGKETQSSLADKLGVNRSVVHRRLTGSVNMTVETIADMAWALGCGVSLNIFDLEDNQCSDSNYKIAVTDNIAPPRLNQRGVDQVRLPDAVNPLKNNNKLQIAA